MEAPIGLNKPGRCHKLQFASMSVERKGIPANSTFIFKI